MGGTDPERLGRAPFRLPRPRRTVVARWSAAASLVALAALVLLAGPPPCPATPPVVRPVPPAGLLGVPLTVSSAATVVRPGDRVDVVTRRDGVLAEDVLVLAVDPGTEGTGLYVAAIAPAARRLAAVAPESPLAITVRPP